MAGSEEKIVCKTPTPGKTPTRIPKWKYDAVRDAVLAVLDSEGSAYFTDLLEKIGGMLDSQTRKELGSLAWHVTTVKLHMEAIGEIKRLPGKGRQQIARV